MILINHASAPIKKERSSSTSKARREASRNEFMEKGGMPDIVESFREISSKEDRPESPDWVRGMPRVTGTLGKASSHFDPT